MSEPDIPTPKTLKRTLDQEYQALLSGNLHDIERLGELKVGLLEQISELPLERFKDFGLLRSDIVRNQELANSAINGMRKALSRVRAIIEVRSELKTYDSLGQENQHLFHSGQRLSKRS